MNRNQARDKFLDLVEDKLPANERHKLEELISNDEILREEFNRYQRLIKVEKKVLTESYSLHEGFADIVMDRIKTMRPSPFRSCYMIVRNYKFGAAATLAFTMVLLFLYQRQTTSDLELIEAKGGQTFDSPSVELAMNEKKPVVRPNAKGQLVVKLPQTQTNTSDDWSKRDEGEAFIKKSDELQLAQTKENIGLDKNIVAQQNAVSPSVPSYVSSTSPFGKADKMPSGLVATLEKTKEQRLERTDGSDPIQRSAGRRSSEISVLSSAEALPPIRERVKAKYDTQAIQSFGRYPDALTSPVFQETNNERYQSVEEGKTFLTRDEAISTFSIDVDTGSYTNTRRLLQMGQLPPPESVRIEEYINYFDYNYPKQTEQPFSLTYEIAPNPLDSSKYLLKLGVKAIDIGVVQKAWNLIFLVDVSGSMNEPNKLPLVKQALKLLVDGMRASDRIGIVTYAGSVGVALDPTGIAAKSQIIAAIDGLSAGGSTYGSGGITTAYELAQRSFIPDGENRIVLATDGDFNVGVSDTASLLRMIEERRARGITLTTLGFGTGNINEGMMEQLSNKGNGNYFYIDSFQEARKVFETDLTGTIEVVAKDVKLQLEFNPAHVAQYRLIGYDNRILKKEDFNNDKIDAGEIGAGHTVTALYEIVLTGSPEATKLVTEYRYQKQTTPEPELNKDKQDEFAFLKVRYKAPGGDISQLLNIPLYARDIRQDANQTSDDFRFAAAVSAFGHLLRKSQNTGNYNMGDVIKVAQSAQGLDSHGYRREFIELARNAERLLPRPITPETPIMPMIGRE